MTTPHGLNEDISDPYSTDEAFRRVRQADPADRAEPDLVALRRAVWERAEIEESAPGEGVGELVDMASRRRRQPWFMAAAAAAVVVVGAGGYVVGAARPGDDAVPGFGPGIVIAGQPAPAGSAEAALEMDRAASGVFPSGRIVFHDGGLSTEPTTGSVWTYDQAGTFSRDTLLAAAAVLGVSGEVREEDGAYVVGSADGTGPSVRLDLDGVSTLSYYDPAKSSTGGCVEPGLSRSSSEPGEEEDPSESCDGENLLPAPSEAEATDLVASVLSEFGVDVKSLDLTFDDWGSGDLGVQAQTTIGGQQTGNVWFATVSEKGMESLSGPMASLIMMGDYPVISPAEAVQRLNDPRFGATSAGTWLIEATDSEDDDPAGPPSAPGSVAPGSAIPWMVSDVSITTAVLGFSTVFRADGAAIMVPTYELTGNDGSSWSMIAVADEALDLAVE